MEILSTLGSFLGSALSPYIGEIMAGVGLLAAGFIGHRAGVASEQARTTATVAVIQESEAKASNAATGENLDEVLKRGDF